MKHLLRLVLSAASVAVLALALPSTARAADITFDQVNGDVGGTVLPSSGGNYVGTNILFDQITYQSSIVYCDASKGTTSTNCLLNFNTATNSFELTAPAGLYDPAGALLPTLNGSSITVLSGTFTAFADVLGTDFVATGQDTKNPALLSYFGITSTSFTFNNTDIHTSDTGTVREADIVNSVPEPGLLTLFGLGLLGVRRKLARRNV